MKKYLTVLKTLNSQNVCTRFSVQFSTLTLSIQFSLAVKFMYIQNSMEKATEIPFGL